MQCAACSMSRVIASTPADFDPLLRKSMGRQARRARFVAISLTDAACTAHRSIVQDTANFQPRAATMRADRTGA
jgi:hypothetical protein